MRIAFGRATTRQSLEGTTIMPAADRALRDLVGACQRQGVRVALVRIPEHSSLRECIPEAIQARDLAYLRAVVRECRVPVIDTRDWVPDADFIDMTHTLPCAAGPYTARFGREVLAPLLAGQLPAPALLLQDDPSASVGQVSHMP
jgi:hypothetical protein